MFAFSKSDAVQEKKALKRVPKGTSDYQAAWITNSDDEEEPDDDENEEDDEFGEEIAEGSDSDQSMVKHVRIFKKIFAILKYCCYGFLLVIFCHEWYKCSVLGLGVQIVGSKTNGKLPTSLAMFFIRAPANLRNHCLNAWKANKCNCAPIRHSGQTIFLLCFV